MKRRLLCLKPVQRKVMSSNHTAIIIKLILLNSTTLRNMSTSSSSPYALHLWPTQNPEGQFDVQFYQVDTTQCTVHSCHHNKINLFILFYCSEKVLEGSKLSAVKWQGRYLTKVHLRRQILVGSYLRILHKNMIFYGSK